MKLMSKLLLENIKVYERFVRKNNLYYAGEINLIQLGGNGETDIDPFYSIDIEELTKQNNDYRRVIFTGQNQQFVLMSIPPKDNIKMEIHKSHDQFIRIEEGEGEAIIGISTYKLQDNTAFIIPAGVSHQIINTSEKQPLKLYTIYSPPEHPDKLIQKTNPDKLISQTIIEKEVEINKKQSEQKGGINFIKKKNIDYEKKYLDYKNKYITLKGFIAKSYYKNN